MKKVFLSEAEYYKRLFDIAFGSFSHRMLECLERLGESHKSYRWIKRRAIDALEMASALGLSQASGQIKKGGTAATVPPNHKEVTPS